MVQNLNVVVHILAVHHVCVFLRSKKREHITNPSLSTTDDLLQQIRMLGNNFDVLACTAFVFSYSEKDVGNVSHGHQKNNPGSIYLPTNDK